MDRGFTRKIVVAGGGNVDCLATIKKEKNFIVINRWIENVEISTLIRKMSYCCLSISFIISDRYNANCI